MAADPRFKYQDITASSGLSVAQMDKLMGFVIDSGTGTWGAIIAGLKLLAIGAYVYARRSLIEDEAERLKQGYGQDQAHGNQDQVDGDNLGSSPKP